MSRAATEREINPGAALSASERRYRRLFEAACDGIVIVDPSTGRIVDVNRFLVTLLGYSRGEFVGRELAEFGRPSDAAACREALADLELLNTVRGEDRPLLTKQGRRVDVEIVSNLYLEGARSVIQCNVRDITDRKRAEDERMAAARRAAERAALLDALAHRRTAELRDANAQIDTLANSIAHDLRAPLRAMQGFAQLLVQDHRADLDETGCGHANFINGAAQRLDRSLAALLAFSDAMQQSVELAPVPLEAVVQSALAGCAGDIDARRARVEIIPPWPVVLAHELTLREVLVNLIANSVNLVTGRPPELRLRAEERPDGIVRIWVEDNSESAPDLPERICQIFHRLRQSATAGSGLGIAIVQQGIERMGGHLGLVTVTAKGSTFWVELFKASVATARPPGGGG